MKTNSHSFARKMIVGILMLLLVWQCRASPESTYASEFDQENHLRWPALNGKSIQIDPSFPYYQNRSVESIVDEIKNAGYNSVHYFVVNENNVNGDLVEAFRKEGIAVWALVLGNGTYSTASYPPQWPEWQMELLEPLNDGYIRLSPFSKEFTQWKKETLAKLVTDYSFDGIEIAEPYFPEWNGIERGVYGDIGTLAQKAFFEKYKKDIPNFTDEASENYYKKNKELYNLWIDFRVDAVNYFLDELINGKNGVREARPDILVATWSLAIDAGENSVNELEEIQGLNAAAMVEKVKPDIHFFQTHWPDWLKSESDLPPDYMKNYQPFVDQLRTENDQIPIGIQADIGSLPYMIKSKSWINEFSENAFNLGYQTWTAYEYHIGGYMYTEAPKPVKALKVNNDCVEISFNKRIDPDTVTQNSILIRKNGEISELSDTEYSVDGNKLFIRASSLPIDRFDLMINGIKDTPKLWLFKDFDANEVPMGSYISVNNNQTIYQNLIKLNLLIESQNTEKSLKNKLRNSLKQVKHHLEKEHSMQAIQQLINFNKHLQSNSNLDYIDSNLKDYMLYISSDIKNLIDVNESLD